MLIAESVHKVIILTGIRNEYNDIIMTWTITSKLDTNATGIYTSQKRRRYIIIFFPNPDSFILFPFHAMKNNEISF